VGASKTLRFNPGPFISEAPWHTQHLCTRRTATASQCVTSGADTGYDLGSTKQTTEMAIGGMDTVPV
jgi:hypothetical protein